MNLYDNQANVIDYFSTQRKREKIELEEISDNEIAELLETILLKRQGLQEMYVGTNSEHTLTAISKLTGFISAIRMQMRKRKIVPYEDLSQEIANLQLQLKDSSNETDADLIKKIKHLELVNENLKNEVKAIKEQLDCVKSHDKNKYFVENQELRERNKSLGNQIEDLKKIISENREAEKTKRHEINIKNGRYQLGYCKSYLKSVLPEDEYAGVIEDLANMD